MLHPSPEPHKTPRSLTGEVLTWEASFKWNSANDLHFLSLLPTCSIDFAHIDKVGCDAGLLVSPHGNMLAEIFTLYKWLTTFMLTVSAHE